MWATSLYALLPFRRPMCADASKQNNRYASQIAGTSGTTNHDANTAERDMTEIDFDKLLAVLEDFEDRGEGAGPAVVSRAAQAIRVLRNRSAEALLREIRDAKRASWSASPEGRAYLQRIDEALNGLP